MNPGLSHVDEETPRDLAGISVAPLIGPATSGVVAKIADLASDIEDRATAEVHAVVIIGRWTTALIGPVDSVHEAGIAGLASVHVVRTMEEVHNFATIGAWLTAAHGPM